ncbi:hypothetical protein TKK_0009554 [Trichogramma kaykai]|uniref:Reverse transcriptase domain-containing protein n=1 Tax=Trichogramma kaykai TaxID=54128 RepID=A0ABD2X0A1_9HYME
MLGIENCCSKFKKHAQSTLVAEQEAFSSFERAKTNIDLAAQAETQKLDAPQKSEQDQDASQRKLLEVPLNQHVSIFVGRLKHFYEVWKELTSDKIILTWVKGFKIPFKAIPVQLYSKTEAMFSLKEKEIISSKIVDLVAKDVVIECEPVEGQFLSPIFTIPKSDNTLRLIFNLKRLNDFIELVHFKMENHETVISLLQKDYFMTSRDIKDAFCTVSVHDDHKKFLQFRFENRLCEFSCLVFGLNVAPYVFTKLLRPVVAYLRFLGIRLVICIDDILIIAESVEVCSAHYSVTANLLRSLGFLLNNKGIKIPTKRCVYLGFMFDSVDMKMELPPDRRHNILKLIKRFINKSSDSLRKFTQFIAIHRALDR